MKHFLIRHLIPSCLCILSGIAILIYSFRANVPSAGLIILMATIVLAGVINSRPIARMLGHLFMMLIDPVQHYDRPQPSYGPARSKRRMREFDAAFLEYEKIIIEHPTEIQPYIEMMEIAMLDLHSPEKLDAIYEQGLNVIQNEDHRANLTRYHGVLKDWSKEQTV
jgi:hypothetical protein